MPPLREREGDVNLLLDHFLKTFCPRFGKRVKGFSSEVRDLLLNYAYPGNVRELRNIIEYATNICQSESIAKDHLPAYLTEAKITGREGDGMEPHGIFPAKGVDREKTSGVNWAAIERQLIVDTLVKVKGHRSRAAEILGWGRSTLWRKMKQYGLES